MCHFLGFVGRTHPESWRRPKRCAKHSHSSVRGTCRRSCGPSRPMAGRDKAGGGPTQLRQRVSGGLLHHQPRRWSLEEKGGSLRRQLAAAQRSTVVVAKVVDEQLNCHLPAILEAAIWSARGPSRGLPSLSYARCACAVQGRPILLSFLGDHQRRSHAFFLPCGRHTAATKISRWWTRLGRSCG